MRRSERRLLSRVSLSYKLMGSFLVILLLLAVVATVSYRGLLSLEASYRDANRIHTAVEMQLRINALVREQGRLAAIYALNRNMEAGRQAQAAGEQAAALAAELTGLVQSDEGRARLVELQEALQFYSAALNKTLQGQTLSQEESAELQNMWRIGAAVDGLIELGNQLVSQGQQAVEAAARQAMTLSMAATGLAV